MRLLRSCDLSRASCPRPFASGRAHPSSHFATQPNLRHTHFLPQARRPHKWGCRLTTSCQVAASSPRTAAVESAEAKSSKQQGQLVTLPTTDESPQLDRIRHSVSTDLKGCCNSRDLYIHPFRCCMSAMLACKAAVFPQLLLLLDGWTALLSCVNKLKYRLPCSAHMSWPWQYRSCSLERKSPLGLLLSAASTTTLTCLSPSQRKT